MWKFWQPPLFSTSRSFCPTWRPCSWCPRGTSGLFTALTAIIQLRQTLLLLVDQGRDTSYSYSCTLHEAATANTALNLLILVCRLLSMASSENLVLHARTTRQQYSSPLLSVTTRPLREKILQMTFRPLDIVKKQSIAIRYLTASVLQEFFWASKICN